MEQFIAEYWLETLFGVICFALGGLVKLCWSLIKKEFKRQEKDMTDLFAKQLNDQRDEIVKIINERENKLLKADGNFDKRLDAMESGILSLHGNEFKKECRKLLETSHEITLAEYENACSEHSVYNALGGNHDGDALFKMVEQKYKNNLNGEV